MDNFFINIGRKLGSLLNKGKWYYKSIWGSEEEAIKAEFVMGKELAANVQRKMKICDDSK